MKCFVSLFCSLALIVCASSAGAQSPVWSKFQTTAGIADEESPRVVKVADGSFYVACTVFFTETEIQHFDSAGSWVWSRVFPGSFHSFDANSNKIVFVTEGADDFATITGGHEFRLNGIDNTGALLWSTLLDSGVIIPIVKIDAGSNSYVTGSIQTQSTGKDVYLAKYNSSGVKQWSNTHDLGHDEFPRALSVDSGGISVAVDRGGDVLADVGACIARYALSGSFSWSSTDAVAIYSPTEISTTVDVSGNVYFAYGTNNGDTTIKKFDSAGNLGWSTTRTSVVAGSDIKVAPSGNVYAFGASASLVSLNSLGQHRWTVAVTNNSSDGHIVLDSSENIYLAMMLPVKIDSSANIKWTASFNDTVQARDVVLDTNGNPIAIGPNPPSAAVADIEFIKLDNSTGAESSRAEEDFGNQATAAIASSTDSLGNTYVYTISSSNYADFAGVPRNPVSSASFTKYTTDGNVAWTKSAPILPADAVPSNSLVVCTNYGVALFVGTKGIAYDPSGNQLWSFPTLLPSYPVASVADANGNVFVGYGSGDVTGSSFVAKVDSSGSIAATFSGAPGILSSITLDSSGNVFACGQELINNLVYQATVTKFNSSAVKQWTNIPNAFTTLQNAMANKVVIGSDGNPVVVGTGTHDDVEHGFVSEMNASDGGGVWYSEPVSAVDYRFAAVDPSGNIFASGLGNSPAVPHLMATKFTSGGTVTWSHIYSSDQKEIVIGLVLDSVNNILIPALGGKDGEADDDLFVGYDANGNLLGSGGSYYDSGWKAIDRPLNAGRDGAGNVFITGRSYDANGVEAAHILKFPAFAPANNAKFITQTVPSSMTSYLSYPVSVTMKNTGTVNWTAAAGFRLDCLEGSTWSKSNVALDPADTIAPGQSKVFSFNVVAPGVNGMQAMQWRMSKSGTQFGQSSTVVNVNVSDPDNAHFVSQVVPLSVIPGGTFTPRVSMQNIGTSTWTQAAGYCLLSLDPTNNKTWGTNRLVIPAAVTVAPGNQVLIYNTLTAPSTPGIYTFHWQMYHNGFLFGEKSASLNIAVFADNAQYISQKTFVAMNPGFTFNANVMMKNTGASTWTQAQGFALISQSPYNNTTWGTNRLLVPSSATVGPGVSITCSNTLHAPMIPGSYVMRWQMYHNGVVFGDLTPAQTIAVQLPGDAQFISQVVPTSIKAGTTFLVKVTMKNTGTTTWTQAAGYYMVSENPLGNATWGTNRLLFPSSLSVAPGAQVVCSGTITAPAAAGNYNLQWRMTRGPDQFGDFTTNVIVSVTP